MHADLVSKGTTEKSDARMSTGSIPTLMDPLQLFFYLIVHAGLVPAAVVAVITALLTSFKAIQGWITATRAGVRGGLIAAEKIRRATSAQLRGILAFGFFSLISVCFSYVLAVIGYTAAVMIRADPQNVFSPGQLATQAQVDLWPQVAVWVVTGEIACVVILAIARAAEFDSLHVLVRRVGRLVWLASWLVVVWLGGSAALMCLGLLVQRGQPPQPDAVPIPLLWDAAIAAVLALVVAFSVPRIDRASDQAFGGL